ncbi:hypothetical protein QYZ88_017130 [Lachnospiraceae bacterium C1.1]|nr:hypothetical protein [Lachnospiraceae bacterium C1.1]
MNGSVMPFRWIFHLKIRRQDFGYSWTPTGGYIVPVKLFTDDADDFSDNILYFKDIDLNLSDISDLKFNIADKLVSEISDERKEDLNSGKWGLTSSDENVIKVSDDGYCEVVGAGSATVSVKTSEAASNTGIMHVEISGDLEGVTIVDDIDGAAGVKVVYPSEISFKSKKASFSTDDVKIYAEDGSKMDYAKISVKKSGKVGETIFKIKNPKTSDKAVKKAIKKRKFAVSIVPYSVSSNDAVDVIVNSKGKIKKVTVNKIKLRKKRIQW